MADLNDFEFPLQPHKGRGAVSNPDGRFETLTHQRIDDGWGQDPRHKWDKGEAQSVHDQAPSPLPTTVLVDSAKSVIARNNSPDVPFDQSINPYRGCEHGCVYCYARPTHAYLGLSPGLDFESRLFYKPHAAQLLEKELRRKNYRCSAIAMGANTDPYQPVERKLRVTRSLLEVLQAFNHPVSMVTKSSMVERDMDLLASMAERNLACVMLSVTTLSADLARRLEPRATAPIRRIETIRRLSEAGIPTGVLVAPMIPALNDAEMEDILKACREAGAESAAYTMLRLPLEVKDLFQEWLAHHEPLKAKRVMGLVRQVRGGKAYNAEFGERMRGSGPVADMIEQRFRLACKRLGFNRAHRELDINQFRPAPGAGVQPLCGGKQLALW